MEWSNVEVGFLKECQVLEPKLTYGSYGFVPLHELRYHEKLRQLESDRAEQKVHQSNQAQHQQQQQMDIDCNSFAQQQEFNHHNADSRKRRTCDENGDEENGPLQDISHANKKFRHYFVFRGGNNTRSASFTKSPKCSKGPAPSYGYSTLHHESFLLNPATNIDLPQLITNNKSKLILTCDSKKYGTDSELENMLLSTHGCTVYHCHRDEIEF
ncbi:hypothetical protein TKK_0015908 [Trichogramma kaykai]|uniref:Uncharacterized protein n=1 Tax=Trichogramma kaykai TaxID=54128 RepID=A0ABD2W8U7_9HYME